MKQNLLLDKNGLWRYHPLPSREKVEGWYRSDILADKNLFDYHLWKPFFDENLKWLDSHKIVDIGAGYGDFVSYVNIVGGWQFIDAIGVEVNPLVENHPHFLTYEQFDKLNTHQYDGRMCLVLEHVYDPVEFLQYWRERIDKLLIIVPNEFNPLQQHLSDHYGYSPIDKQHLSYFTPQSLRNVCEAADWRVVRESATFPMELFVKFGFNYIGDKEMGNKCHRVRLRFENWLGPLAFRLYEFWYKKFGWGRELMFLCVSDR